MPAPTHVPAKLPATQVVDKPAGPNTQLPLEQPRAVPVTLGGQGATLAPQATPQRLSASSQQAAPPAPQPTAEPAEVPAAQMPRFQRPLREAAGPNAAALLQAMPDQTGAAAPSPQLLGAVPSPARAVAADQHGDGDLQCVPYRRSFTTQSCDSMLAALLEDSDEEAAEGITKAPVRRNKDRHATYMRFWRTITENKAGKTPEQVLAKSQRCQGQRQDGSWNVHIPV